MLCSRCETLCDFKGSKDLVTGVTKKVWACPSCKRHYISVGNTVSPGSFSGGPRFPTRKLSEKERGAVLAMKDSGKSIKEIALEMKTTYHVVYRVCRSMEGPPREPLRIMRLDGLR